MQTSIFLVYILSLSIGDQYDGSGIVRFIELIKEVHEGIFIYSVRLSDDPSKDQRAAWVCALTYVTTYHILTRRAQFGNVDEQVAQVADQFANITELKNGFDAIGFSQGT